MNSSDVPEDESTQESDEDYDAWLASIGGGCRGFT
jgi:hypothetical protein